uniref:Actin-related family protein n=1 Tax=Rhizophora mucronata TaxID=61149 RepID=A0A2P2JDJ8_RHIMU
MLPREITMKLDHPLSTESASDTFLAVKCEALVHSFLLHCCDSRDSETDWIDNLGKKDKKSKGFRN